MKSSRMNYLIAGNESKQRVELLLSLTKITSDQVKDSITDHLCAGYSQRDAVILNGVTQSNFTRAMRTLNDVACIVEKIKALDWQHIKSVK